MDVTVEIEDEVAVIRFDDGKKNALTMAALQAIEAALERATEQAKAIVLAGRPGSFCAGFDINVLKSGDRKAFGELGQRGAKILYRLYASPKPIVSACTGHAFTIGALWLLASDTRIGEEGPYKFGMTETALGQSLPPWALEPLKARIDPRYFIPVVTQSETYDPAGAERVGFLDHVVPAGTAIDAARDIAKTLAQLPAKAYGDNKLSTRQHALEIMKNDLNL